MKKKTETNRIHAPVRPILILGSFKAPTSFTVDGRPRQDPSEGRASARALFKRYRSGTKISVYRYLGR